MKRLLCVLVFMLLLCSCSDKKQDDSTIINYTYDIVTKPVDMSEYDGLNSTNHMFVGITVDELFHVIDDQSSGVFYLGRSNCGCCQTCVKYLNEVASNLNVTVYYINVNDSQEPFTDEIIDKLTEYLYDILAEENGKKALQTPTVFSVINGEIVDSLICLSDWRFDDPPTDNQVRKLENKYTEILKPFAG